MAELNVTIGDLRTRITLQTPTLTKDVGGAQSPAYVNVATNPTVWAQWINDHGQEAVSSEAKTFGQRATVRLRHRADIETTWQVLKAGAPWQILSIDFVQNKQRWVELRVERVKGTV